jgi:transcriptional regulator with GAF, ATPase, and Fis domain
MLSYINMFMVDYKTEQDALWESLDDAFPSIELKTNLADEVADLERSRIIEALSTHSGNQTKAAKALNLGRVTFIAKAKKYELV